MEPALDKINGLERWQPMSRRGRLVLFLLLAVILPLQAGIVLFAGRIARPPVLPLPAVDGIVALTGGDNRVSIAVKLLGEKHGARLLITGANPTTSRAEIRRRMAQDHGSLFQCCIDIGYAAHDTVSNADETRQWANHWKYSRLLVVTSNYHMPRALAELSRAMPQATFVPYPVASRSLRLEAWWLHPRSAYLIGREYLKFLAAYARQMLARLV